MGVNWSKNQHRNEGRKFYRRLNYNSNGDCVWKSMQGQNRCKSAESGLKVSNSMFLWEVNFFLGVHQVCGLLLFTLLGVRNLGNQRYFEGFKNKATQGWTDNRTAKETTETLNCDGLDLMSEIWKFGIWYWNLDFCRANVSLNLAVDNAKSCSRQSDMNYSLVACPASPQLLRRRGGTTGSTISEHAGSWNSLPCFEHDVFCIYMVFFCIYMVLFCIYIDSFLRSRSAHSFCIWNYVTRSTYDTCWICLKTVEKSYQGQDNPLFFIS